MDLEPSFLIDHILIIVICLIYTHTWFCGPSACAHIYQVNPSFPCYEYYILTNAVHKMTLIYVVMKYIAI